MRGEKVTKETVEKVKAYLGNDKYAELTQDELSLLTGVSASTISRINSGGYDHLLDPTVSKDESGDISVPITYEALKRLIACEYVVDSIIKLAGLHEQIDNVLFINNKTLYGILRAYVPEDVDRRLAELREEV